MKYHKQEHLFIPGQSKGSCYPTVLACLLDKELHDVPYFHLAYWSEEEKKNLDAYAVNHYLNGMVFSEAEENMQSNYHHFKSQSGSLWDIIRNIWLISQGWKEDHISDLKIEEFIIDNPDTPYMASGMSSRGVQHVVIYMNGKLLHDPHPSNEGLLKVDYYTYLIPALQDYGKYYKYLKD